LHLIQSAHPSLYFFWILSVFLFFCLTFIFIEINASKLTFFILIDLEPLHKVTLKDREHFYTLLKI
jgi:hypothetical protein